MSRLARLLTLPIVLTASGSHRLTWDGLDRNGVAAPTGVYINASRKALLVR